MNISEMSVEDIERELAQREKIEQDTSTDLQAGGYLDIARAEMRRNPSTFMEKNPSITNKILELDAQTLAKKSAKLYRANHYNQSELENLTATELQKLMLEEFAQFIPDELLENFYAIGINLVRECSKMAINHKHNF